MKAFLTLIVSLFLTIVATSQNLSDSGFTNKAEAKNLMVNGLKEGKWFEYRSFKLEGRKRHLRTLIVYKAGEPFGIVREYSKISHKWLLKRETPYKDGKKNGLEKCYYDDGKLSSTRPYINDKDTGEAKDYYESGKLEYENTDSTVMKWYENGNLEWVDYWKNHKKNGMSKSYYEDGKLELECLFTDGKAEGVAMEYYENGVIKRKTTYVNDKKNGVEKEYFETGKLKSETMYTNGIAGTTKNYDENGNEIK